MVKKTKGLSFDEKKLALSSAMKKEGLCYNLKELEVLGKKNGVIPQAVKEVVDCLVAERVVIQEKIGSLNIFWSFHSSGKIDPIQNLETQRTKLNDIRSEITRLSGICCNQDITEDAIRQMQSRVSDLELKVSDLAVHLNRLLQSDPATIKKLSEGIGQVKHFANICTENIFVMRQYFVRKFGACEEDIDKEFGIPSDFDCL